MPNEQFEYRYHTPPKYANKLDERNRKVLLEDRLAHFIAWLADKGVVLLVRENGDIASEEYNAELIDEYMNE